MNRQEPREYRYVVQAWLPNTTYEPQEFGMNDLDAAVRTAHEIAHDGGFYQVTVLDPRVSLEMARIVSERFYRNTRTPKTPE